MPAIALLLLPILLPAPNVVSAGTGEFWCGPAAAGKTNAARRDRRAARVASGDGTAGRFDRSLGAGRGQHALERELLGQLALLDDLGLLGVRRHELGGLEGGQVDVTGVQLVQRVQQHFGRVLLDQRAEADLGQATLHGHLTAFEAGLDLALARTRERTLVAAAAGLAKAGADTTADALAVGAGAIGGLQSVETHVDYSSTRTR